MIVKSKIRKTMNYETQSIRKTYKNYETQNKEKKNLIHLDLFTFEKKSKPVESHYSNTHEMKMEGNIKNHF